MPPALSKFNSIFAFVMNQARYDALPAELKKVIDANAGAEASAWAGGTGFDRRGGGQPQTRHRSR